jgi:hypothetical protein
MSYENPIPTDCIYSNFNQSTALSSFTTEDNLQKTYPPVILRPGLFANLQATGKSLHIRASMRLGTTGAPTFQWSLRLLTSTTWSAGGILLGTSAALTAGTTQTLAPCFLDVSIGLKTLAIAAASTLRTMGEVRGPLALASPFAGTIPANNTSPDVSTFDNSQQYYLFVSAACGTNNALNLVQMEQLKVYGDN